MLSAPTAANGLPLAVLELKDPVDEKADTQIAYRQLETCKAQIFNSLLTSHTMLYMMLLYTRSLLWHVMR